MIHSSCTGGSFDLVWGQNKWLVLSVVNRQTRTKYSNNRGSQIIGSIPCIP